MISLVWWLLATHGMLLTWNNNFIPDYNTVYQSTNSVGPFVAIYQSNIPIEIFDVPRTAKNQGTKACWAVTQTKNSIESDFSNVICDSFTCNIGHHQKCVFRKGIEHCSCVKD